MWTAIEDAPNEFNDKINHTEMIQKMFKEGKKSFSDLADFNFIAGYTVSIFPYEYGNYDDLEIEAKQMLKKATEIEPKNLIYKFAYLGSIVNDKNEEYQKLEVEVAPIVLETFSGKGLLNKYFRQVLYRINKKV